MHSVREILLAVHKVFKNSPEALDSHVNASFTALNLAKAALQQQQPTTEPLRFSIASYKRLALNEHLLDLSSLAKLNAR